MFYPKQHINLDESQIISHLLDWQDAKGYPDLRHFYHTLYHPVGPDGFSRYTGLLAASNVMRTELGFRNDAKPGDFDIVLIPFSKEKIYFECTAVYEVKVVRPTRAKPDRNANSLGVTQAMGLVQDGFPLVSLLHICMPEPLLDKEKMKMPIERSTHFLDIVDPAHNKSFWEEEEVLVDWFPMDAADRQMKRLITTELPKYVTLGALGFNVFQDGSFGLNTCSQDFWAFQQGHFNPHLKQETIDKVKVHVLENWDRYIIKPLVQ